MGTMQLKLAIAGEKIVIAGLALQVATFVVFLVALIDFEIRMSKKTTTTGRGESSNWKKMLWILKIVSSLILLRCIFRLVEYAMGNASYLIAHEWTLYAFDAVPMFLVSVLLLVFQPTKYVSKEYRRQSNSSNVEELTTSGGK